MIALTVLGSGSGGNAAVVSCGSTRLLLDCGFSARETARRMAAAGFEADGIHALLVTHEHADHVSGVRVFARRHHVPVLASAGTLGASGLERERGCECTRVRAGETTRVGDLAVIAFATSHDCAEPLGFVFEDPDGTRLGIATDTGFASGAMLEALAGCRVLGIEANHDLRMLETGPYPLFLRRRIAGERGHLSNEAAADALERLAHEGLREVVGLHVSRQNNLPSLASRALRARLGAIGLDGVAVAVASQDDVLGGGAAA